MQVLFTKQTEKDICDITKYIARDNVSASEYFVESLLHTLMTSLSEQPLLGKVGRVQNTREFTLHSSYIAVYRIKEDIIEILSIRHTSRTWPECF